MSKSWKPISRIANGCAKWLRAPQPRSGAGGWDLAGDADGRRARADLDAVRARFPDHA
jgi:hypothetical protein